jgi:FMN phosphatase YigB (HAD superfamily)
LIIFDLDDTIIDTSGSVTPFKLERALEAMLGRGPSSHEIEELCQLSQRGGSKRAVIEWAERHGHAPDKGIFELIAPLPEGFRVKCTPGAKEFLEGCPAELALVTIGSPSFQLEKLKKAGIEESIFSKIVILEGPSKKSSYQSLVGDNIWVCGDKIETDLLPGHELGFRTVHMRWGRERAKKVGWVNHSIESLLELRDILG